MSHPEPATPPDPLLAEIGRQPAAIRGAAAALVGQRDGLRRIAASLRPGGRIVLTGMGSSFDAGHVTVAVLGQAGIPVEHVNAAELLHFRLSTLDDRTTLVVVSQSGQSVEVVRLLERLDRDRRRRPFLVGVTNGTDNPLADAADVAVDIAVGAELGPATMTFAATLVALDALGRVLEGAAEGDIDAVLERVTLDADAAGIAMERLLADRPAITATMVAWHGGRRNTVIVGRGAGRAASDMASLTLKEVAGAAAESMITADFRHGPLELVRDDLAIAFVCVEAATDAIDRAFAAELAPGPASVVIVGADAAPVPQARAVAIGQVPRSLAPAVAVVPFQLLGRELAIAGGRTPGDFRHAAKVTTTE
jgi:glutamine---fructose-6-phosphate transaminase (isomerizing)